MGLTLLPDPPTDKALRKRYDKILRDYGKTNGKRPSDNLKIRVPPYSDAGRARAMDAILADRMADCDEEYAKHIGHEHAIGYVTRATNGHYLIGETIPHGHVVDRPRQTYDAPVLTWTLTPDIWRMYARVRTCRSEKTQRVTITTGDLGMAFHADDPDGGWSAHEATDGWYPDGKITIDDRYLWPLRGMEWTAGLTGTASDPNTALHLRAGRYAVLIMGVRA